MDSFGVVNSSSSIIKPKKPSRGRTWALALDWICPPELKALGYPIAPFRHIESGLFVLSAVEVAIEGGKNTGPHYHLSISLSGRRCTSADALFVLQSFCLEDALEDNHVPSGRVRNFWRPVTDAQSGMECPCVKTEPAIKEDKGDYVWRGT